MALILSPELPLPLLSTILDTLFNNFQAPTVSLMSAPVLTTVAAGLRAALVVDIGWAETVVTAVYEYREVQCQRSIRATQLLSWEMLKLIRTVLRQTRGQQKNLTGHKDEKTYQDDISFEECEEIVARLAWCRPPNEEPEFMDALEGLPPVPEGVEPTISPHDIRHNGENMIIVPLCSLHLPITLRLPFSIFAEPCERAFFADGIEAADLDDEELPLHLLVYRSLLNLSVDVRAVCMARIVFVGGGSNVTGLKNRVINEVQGLVQDRGWDPIRGKAVEQLRNNVKKHTNRVRKSNDSPTEAPQAEHNIRVRAGESQTVDQVAFGAKEVDPIEEKVRRETQKGTWFRPPPRGILRAVESVGAWSGGSILSLFKVPTVSLVEREQWLQHGATSASKQSELPTTNQKQSVGPSGLRVGPGDRSSWTLGPWG